MFTEQIATLGAILRANGLDDGAAAAFEQLLGSCSASLSHRGTVNLPGASFIQVAPQGQRADYTKIDFNDNTQINVPPTTPLRGALYWGIAEGSASEVGDEWIVSVRACDDRFGGGLRGAPFNVYCNPTGGKEPLIDSGDAIVYGWALKRRGGKDYVPVWVNTYQKDFGDDGGSGVETCLLTCGYVDNEGCYVTTERTFTFPPGTTWVDGTTRRFWMCTPSQPPSRPPSQPPSYPPSDPPPHSDSDDWSWSTSGGAGWTDDDIVWVTLIVHDVVLPADANGQYSPAHGYYHGRPLWYRYGATATWMIWWNTNGAWMLTKIGDPSLYWYKKYDLHTPIGFYSPAPSDSVDGVAHVTWGGF